PPEPQCRVGRDDRPGRSVGRTLAFTCSVVVGFVARIRRRVDRSLAQPSAQHRTEFRRAARERGSIRLTGPERLVRPIIRVDLGAVRIGLAIAELPGPRARPLATVARGATPAEDVAAIRRAGAANELDLVVGLPLEASGAAGPMAAAAHDWADAVAALTTWQ